MMRAFLLLLTLCTALHAGSADALITGKTSSGRTSLELQVQDIEGVIQSIKLTIDGKSYTFSGKDTVIRDKKNEVYVLICEDTDHIFHLWMIPGSEKIIKEESGAYKSTFAAIIEATDPRKDNKWTLTPRITIGCTLNYEI